jgi:hypothetical protein
LKEYELCNTNIFLLHNYLGVVIGDVLGPAAELMGVEFLIMFVLIV